MNHTAITMPAAVYCPEAPVHPDTPPYIDATVLPRRPESVRSARRWVRDILIGLGACDDTVWKAVQIVSEIGQNAVRHVHTDPNDLGVMAVTVVTWAGQVRITVSDPGAMFAPPAAGPNGSGEHESGYGEGIIAMLSASHGVTPIHGGKAVWAELPMDGGA